MFEYWLHSECGYSYLGERSLYRLTIPELARLRRGFRVYQEAKEESAEEQAPSDHAAQSRAKRANPHRGTVGPRQSDRELVENFDPHAHGNDRQRN